MYDVAIIGAGPAGLTAAIYAKRAKLNVVVFESEAYGGKLTKTYEINNYPGIKSISGFELANNFIEHAKDYDIEIINSIAIKIDNKGDEKIISLSNGQIYKSKTIILCTGLKETPLQLPRVKEFEGRGISYCAVCDGFFFKNKPVAVIGGGNSALEEALHLVDLVSKLHIIIRRDEFRADKSIVEKILNNEKIVVHYKSLPHELVIENDKIIGLQIKNVDNDQIDTLEVNGIFPYLGQTPISDLVDSSIINEKGYIVVDQNMATTIPGIYAAGDCIEKNLRQIITACNDGAIAATSIVKYLK